MQKGIFLLAMRGPAGWRHHYTYVPYDWGPYSVELARDVDELLQEDLLEREEWEHKQYRAYRTTALGERAINKVTAQLTDEQMRFVAKVRRFVTTRSFSELLRDVYAAYPEYATRSRFTG